MTSTNEELGHLREALKRQHEDMLALREFADWLVTGIISRDENTSVLKHALSLKGMSIDVIKKRYDELPEVKK